MTNESKPGYGEPPKSTRFQKGLSGNPKGRPKNRHRTLPHEAVLGQMVTIRDEGEVKQVTAEQAFLLHLTQKGLSGESAENRYLLDAVQRAKAICETSRVIQRESHVWFVSSGIEFALEALGIVTNKYTTDESRTRCELNPWIVEKALERLEWIGLSEEEQRTVWEATRTPKKVKWPDWWTYRPE